VIGIQGPNLSAADREKMDEFRQCMQDNGAPAPPDPSTFDPSKAPPKAPSEADQEKLKQAFEACQDKLPRDVQHDVRDAGPRIGTCGPPPGAAAPDGKEQGQQKNQDQSDSSGTDSSGSGS
jgi:hypothetical protein